MVAARLPTDSHYRALRPTCVGVFGGSAITPVNASVCALLGARLAQQPGIIVVNGGYEGSKRTPDRESAAYAAVNGALEVIEERGDWRASGSRPYCPRQTHRG